MTLYLRPSEERGHVQMGWLDTRHSFSFGQYHDPKHVHFGPIRVINDDVVKGGAGFPSHDHDNMEILTYVLEGALAHKDSIGTGSTIKAGDVQIMSAGSGITHSEFNPSATESTHLLQIWIFPKEKNIAPRYAQKTLPDTKGLLPIAVPGGSDTAVDIKQDIKVFRWLGAGETDLLIGKGLYVHAIKGDIEVGDTLLKDGDAVGLCEGDGVTLKSGSDDAHALVFTF